MLGQEQKPALNNSSRPQEYDYSRGPLTNTPVAYLELGTELLRGLVWAGCVSLWGGKEEIVKNLEEHYSSRKMC